MLDTEMLKTSSRGECGNDDLPGDQAPFDKQSLYFDSDPLLRDFDSFGFPRTALTLSVDRPIASLAIRLDEVSPDTGASHLVTYRFFNLAYRGGDMAEPQAIETGVLFQHSRAAQVVSGYTFKRGWRIRLAVSPSFYPTLRELLVAVTLTIETGETGGFPASALILPGRETRSEDMRAQRLLPAKSAGAYVNPATIIRRRSPRLARP